MQPLRICTFFLVQGAQGNSLITTACPTTTRSLAEVPAGGTKFASLITISNSAGHYGVVKIGHRIIDGEPFAVKSILKKRPLYVLMMVRSLVVALRPVLPTYSSYLQRNEIRILEEAKHPYIIRLIDTFEEPDVVQ